MQEYLRDRMLAGEAFAKEQAHQRHREQERRRSLQTPKHDINNSSGAPSRDAFRAQQARDFMEKHQASMQEEADPSASPRVIVDKPPAPEGPPEGLLSRQGTQFARSTSLMAHNTSQTFRRTFRFGTSVLPEANALLQQEMQGRVTETLREAVDASTMKVTQAEVTDRLWRHRAHYKKLGKLEDAQCELLSVLDTQGWDQDQETGQAGVLHPSQGFKLKWDLCFVGLIMYSAVAIPYAIGFDVTFTGFLAVVDILVDVAYLLDICVSFRTAYHNEKGKIVYNPRKIARHYLRGEFTLDFAASAPLDRILTNLTPSSEDRQS